MRKHAPYLFWFFFETCINDYSIALTLACLPRIVAEICYNSSYITHRWLKLGISPSIESSLQYNSICMEYEINNAFEVIILLFWAKVKNKACLPQLLSPFVSFVLLRAIRTHLGVIYLILHTNHLLRRFNRWTNTQLGLPVHNLTSNRFGTNNREYQ